MCVSFDVYVLWDILGLFLYWFNTFISPSLVPSHYAPDSLSHQKAFTARWGVSAVLFAQGVYMQIPWQLISVQAQNWKVEGFWSDFSFFLLLPTLQSHLFKLHNINLS